MLSRRIVQGAGREGMYLVHYLYIRTTIISSSVMALRVTVTKIRRPHATREYPSSNQLLQ